MVSRNLRTALWTLIGALIVMAGFRPAWASTVVVSTSDAAQAAVNAANPGDEIDLADGTYPVGLVLRRSGTQDAPITLKALHRGKAVFSGYADAAVRFLRADWWKVDGIKAVDCAWGFHVGASSHITITHVITVRAKKFGLLAGYSDDLVIDGADFGYTLKSTSGDYRGTGCYVSMGCDRAVVRHVNSHDNGGSGIQVNGEGAPITGVLIEGCTCKRNGRSPDQTTAGAAINLLVLTSTTASPVVVRQCVLMDNYSGGVAMLWTATGSDSDPLPLIDTVTVSFQPGVGRSCLSVGANSKATYKGCLLVPPDATHAVVVGGKSTLVDGGGNTVFPATNDTTGTGT